MSVMIKVKYLAPTNTKGARVKATINFAGKSSTTVAWDYALNDENNFLWSAIDLAKFEGFEDARDTVKYVGTFGNERFYTVTE